MCFKFLICWHYFPSSLKICQTPDCLMSLYYHCGSHQYKISTNTITQISIPSETQSFSFTLLSLYKIITVTYCKEILHHIQKISTYSYLNMSSKMFLGGFNIDGSLLWTVIIQNIEKKNRNVIW